MELRSSLQNILFPEYLSEGADTYASLDEALSSQEKSGAFRLPFQFCRYRRQEDGTFIVVVYNRMTECSNIWAISLDGSYVSLATLESYSATESQRNAFDAQVSSLGFAQ